MPSLIVTKTGAAFEVAGDHDAIVLEWSIRSRPAARPAQRLKTFERTDCGSPRPKVTVDMAEVERVEERR